MKRLSKEELDRVIDTVSAYDKMFKDYVPVPTDHHFERDLLEFLYVLKNEEGKNTLADLGACVGQFSLYAKVLGFQNVYAFEPEQKNFLACQKNSNLSGLEFNAYNECLSCGANEVTFQIGQDYAGGHHKFIIDSKDTIGRKSNGGPTVTMNTVSLDRFVEDGKLAQPDVIKIDVDGAEYRVLVGAEKCLKAAAAVHIELDPAEDVSEKCKDILVGHGYKEVFSTQICKTGLRNYWFVK